MLVIRRVEKGSSDHLKPGAIGRMTEKEFPRDIGTSVDCMQSRYAVMIAASEASRPILAIYRVITLNYRLRTSHRKSARFVIEGQLNWGFLSCFYGEFYVVENRRGFHGSLARVFLEMSFQFPHHDGNGFWMAKLVIDPSCVDCLVHSSNRARCQSFVERSFFTNEGEPMTFLDQRLHLRRMRGP